MCSDALLFTNSILVGRNTLIFYVYGSVEHWHRWFMPAVRFLDPCRAPHLLAALLGSGTIAPQLLPLLAEPAARALRGLSITARRAQPSTAVPFLEACL
jgi:hypothetical protein